MINFELSPYAISIFLSHFMIAAIIIYYLLRFLFLLKSEEPVVIYKIIGLCLSSLVLIFCMSFGVFEGINERYSKAIYLTSWSFGLLSYFFYLGVMKLFFNITNKMYITCHKVYGYACIILFADLLYFYFNGTTNLHVRASIDQSHFYEIMNFNYMPSIPGILFVSIFSITFLINAVYLIKLLRKEYKKEVLVFTGVIISLISLLNDTVLGAGLAYYGFPLSFLGSIFELTRFSNYYSFKYQIRSQKLETEISKVTRVAQLGLNQARISHDIVNNLANIILMSRIINKSLEDESRFDFEKVKMMSDKVSKNAKRADDIVKKYNSLVHYSEKEEHECNLKKCVDDAIEDLELQFSKNKIEITNHISTDLIANISETELYIISTNMIKNSVHEISQLDSPFIKIEASKNNSEIELRITDSGNGIDENLAHKIFDTQYTTKEINEGTGLGLSTVKELLEINKGSISIDHTSENTCFLITLPTS